MAVLTQSVLDRVVFVTGDPQYKRFKLPAISRFMNEAQSIIAERAPRSAATYRVLTLAAGARQDLRVIDSATSWIRLHEIVCNASGAGAPTGKTMRRIDRAAMDNAFASWRGAPNASEADEYSLDERDAFTFDVFPPVTAGAKVYALASVRPEPVCVLNTGGTALADPAEVITLADGYDIPVVDWVLFRLFSRDSSDAGYAGRAQGHFQAAQAALGVTLADAKGAA